MISVPKRLRGFLADRPQAVMALTSIFLEEIERLLRKAAGASGDGYASPSPQPRLGAVSFLHRFGSVLNRHVHLHACVTDGVFASGPDGIAFLPARPISPADLATLTERVRRRLVRWFRRRRLIDAETAADMLAWENSGFSSTGRKRKSSTPDAQGFIHLSPHELLDRLADLVPRPRKHRHRYHGVFAPNHRLRKAVTGLAIGNASTPHPDASRVSPPPRPPGQGRGERAGNTGSLLQSPRSHDTSRIAWAKLLARIGETFPLQCPNCGGDIRLIAFITDPRPIRNILEALGEPLEPPPLEPARGPPDDLGELVQVHDDRDVVQAAPDELPVIDIHSL